MYKLIVLFSIIATGMALVTTPVGQCKNIKEKLFKDVVVKIGDEVCTELPCVMKSGTNVTNDVSFVVPSPVKTMKLKMNITVNGRPIDYPMKKNNNACKWLVNSTCPIKANSEVKIHYVFPVKGRYPGVTLVTPYLLDQDKKIIFCFKLPIKVIV